MTIQQFVSKLTQRGIRLWIEGERLCIDAPKGALDASLKEQLRARMKELVPYLKSQPASPTPSAPIPPLAVATAASAIQAPPPDHAETIRSLLAETLLMDANEIAVDEPMADLGLDSILLVEVVKRLNERLGINIKANTLYDYPTVAGLAAHLRTLVPEAPVDQADGYDRVASSATPASASAPAPQHPVQTATAQPDAEHLLTVLKGHVGEVLLLDPSAVDEHEPLADLGLDSILLVELIKRINDALNLNIKANVVYDHPTATALAEFLAGQLAASTSATPAPDAPGQVGRTSAPPPAPIANPVALRALRSTDAVVSEAAPTPISPAAKTVSLRQDRITQAVAEPTPPPSLTPIQPYADGTSCQGLLIRRVGDVADMVLQDLVVPHPGPLEIQIRVVASALNFPDVLCVRGLYPTMPEYPFVPGFEAAGWVEQVGSAVTRFKVGDPVIAVMGSALGGHAQLVNTPESLAVRKPDNISFQDACALPVAFLTAWFSLCEVGRMERGEHVLIQTAAGGVGLIAVQLAHLKGAIVYGTSSSLEKREYLKRIGVDHVIDYTDPNFTEQVRALSGGRGVDIVLNTLSGDMIQKGIDVLAPSGRYLEIAVAGLRASGKLKLSHMVENQSFHSIDLRRLIKTNPQWPVKYLDLMATMVRENLLQANVKQVFSADQAVEGLNLLANRTGMGKLVLTFGAEAPLALQASPSTEFMHPQQKDVAVIGISCRFPGAPDKDRFWENLMRGVVSTTEVPAFRWDVMAYFDTDRSQPNKTYSKWGGFLEDVDLFDAAFFKISPIEAELMDPQQRLFLEEAWRALEDAGYATHNLNGLNCGIFVGASHSDYSQRALGVGQDLGALNLVGNSNAVLASRISYFLNFSGPALTLDTACSSSSVAVHSGCRSILSGECDMVVAGGVSICAGPSMHIMASKLEILSPTGKSRTLDEKADGWVIGEGVGVLVLKAVDKALADGNHIYGVIKASGVNHNGMGQGIVAPKAAAHTALQKSVYSMAGITPDTIQYVELMGTSTLMGDNIEVSALRESFQSFTDRKRFCAVGSLKPNIGHPLTASGAACLIKVLMSLHTKVLPKTLLFGKANAELDLDNSPFYINGETTSWLSPKGTPRRAAVNSFGFSGTNCHLLLEEAPPLRVPSCPSAPNYFIPLSAKTEPALNRRIADLAAWLEGNQPVSMSDIAYTLLAGRSHYKIRTALVVSEVEELRRQLRAALRNPQGQLMPRNEVETDAIHQPERLKQGQQLLEALATPAGMSAQEHREKLDALAELYLSGFDPDAALLFGKGPFKRISLPAYPFLGKSYWLADKSVPLLQEPAEPSKPVDLPVAAHKPDLAARLNQELIQLVADLLKVDPTHIDLNEELSELGFDSVVFIMFANKVNAIYDLDLTPPIFYEFTSLAKLSKHLLEEYATALAAHFSTDAPLDPAQPRREVERRAAQLTQNAANQPIAIIGKSGIMPGSADLDQFWANLERGADLIGVVPAERWDWLSWNDGPYARWGGFMEGVDLFDAPFFGISPREADMMDPQHRLYLQTLWHCMEDAGYSSESFAGSNTGVFVGMGSADYFELLVAGNIRPTGHSTTGYLHSVLPNRISFLLDLHGPSEVINTACSSSLVAIERAVTCIRSGRCDLAFAGGVQLILGPRMHQGIGSAGMLSPGGRCKTFDASADGYVRGEGVGVILLKSLRQAQEDGDRIQAVIRGCAVNHGGRAQSLTAPNTSAQTQLLVKAYTNAAVDPASIGYIETHGTGTKLGDPVEINALKNAFQELYAAWDKPLPSTPHCGLGSVKSHIGHLESAAGISGVLKMILALQHRKLPAGLHLETPNPYIHLKGSPFYLLNQTRDWESLDDGEGKALPRRCGVSSFGFGGVNAHVVLEEYTAVRPATPDLGSCLLVLSAMNEQRLRAVAERLVLFLSTQGDELSLTDLTYTLQIGRKPLDVRLATAVANIDEARQKLTSFLQGTTAGIWVGNMFDGITGQQVDNVRSYSLDELAQLWVNGAQINWLSLYVKRPNRIGLPGYPFEKKRYWFAENQTATGSAVQTSKAPVTQTFPPVEPATAEKSAPAERAQASKDSSAAAFRRQLRTLLAQLMHMEAAELDERKPFVDQGLDSILSVEFVDVLNREFALSEKAELLYSYPDIKSLAAYLAENHQSAAKNSPEVVQPPQVAAKLPPSAVDARQVKARIISLFAEVLTVADAEINPHKPFVDHGLDSILSVEFTHRLNGEFSLSEKAELLYSYPTVEHLANYLAARITPAPAPARAMAAQPVASPKPAPSAPAAAAPTRDLRAISATIVAQLAQVLCINPDEVNRHKPFVDQGLDSILSVEFTANLNEALAIDGKAELLYSYPTVESLASYLAGLATPLPAAIPAPAPVQETPAIVTPSRQDTDLRARLKALLAEVLCLDTTALDDRKSFADQGLDSILSVELIDRFNQELALNLKANDLYTYPNMNELCTHLTGLARVEATAPAISAKLVPEPKPIKRNPAPLAAPSENRAKAAPLRMKRPETVATGNTRPPGTKLSLSNLKVQSTLTSSAPAHQVDLVKPPSHAANAPMICDIAVIGMACRFAGASDTNSFWQMLCAGTTGVTEVPKNRWSAHDWYDPDPTKEGKTSCKWAGFLDNPAQFDPAFFDLSAEQAKLMDPQQRIFLEEAWHALENAGYNSDRLNGVQCGVLVGVSNNDYGKMLYAAANDPDPGQGLLGNANAILPARIAYHLNLKGPALALDTACSSSSVAIHLACRALREGETDMMLAGGVTLYLNARSFVVMSKAGMLSKRGQTRAFDDQGDGFVPGEGVGVVVLKRLEDALADHDTIHGVIKGSGINQNGRSNGITAPNAEGQRDLQLQVYRRYGIDPATIDYVETHGTASKLGDSMEITALSASFGQFTNRKQFCGIGAVKSNLGHTTAAAGVAGLIKLLLSLTRESLPPTACFDEPNSYINFPDSPFYVVEQARPWPRNPHAPRRAALNASGFSGTNSHLVVEEAPLLARPTAAEVVRLYPFSARTESALRANLAAVANALENNAIPGEPLARTLLMGRTHFEKRIAFVANSVTHLVKLMREALDNSASLASPSSQEPADMDLIETTTTELVNAVSAAIRTEKATALASWFVAGADLPWRKLAGTGPSAVLPGYVFDHQDYWLDTSEEQPLAAAPRPPVKTQVEQAQPKATAPSAAPAAKADAKAIPTDLASRTQAWLTALISGHVKDGGPLKPDQSFVAYGVDSFLTLKIVKELEQTFGSLRKTLLFEKFNLKALSKWLLENHLDKLQERFAAEREETPAAQAVPSRQPMAAPVEPSGPTIILERRLDERPDLKAKVAAIYRDHRGETSVAMSRWEIAPYLFIGATAQAYFNFNRKQDLLFVWAYTGPQEAHAALVDELCRWCREQGVQMNIFGEQRLESAAGEALTATPISVMQRIYDLSDFNLSGNKMRRLRYMIQKFEKVGDVRTTEYSSGSDPQTDKDIAHMVDRWCSVRTQINPFIHRIREDLAAGRLSREHRIFVTWLDGALCNLIIITALKPGEGYLMDIEFYPDDMPLGGLEYTIVQMIEMLKAEGCPVLSLGGTFGAQVEESPNADQRIVAILEDLRAHGKFGQGNFQFKNKFRTTNSNIYLCRPVGADPATITDIMMMIADPEIAEEGRRTQTEPAPETATAPELLASGQPMSPREAQLHRAGYNPMNMAAEQVELDLATDSWAELMNATVLARMNALMTRCQEEADLDRSLKQIFPFKHVIPVASGRMAEAYYAAALPRQHRHVVQNLLFPTWIYHQINGDFSPAELPDPAVFDLNSDALFRGNLDLDALRAHLAEKPVAFACIEVGNNAAGGYPIALANLKEVRAILQGIPLVIDATRIMENSVFIRDNEPGQAGRDLWDITRETCALADCITASLAKDFCVNTGGIIATNDDQLAENILETIGARGSGLTSLDRKLIAVALSDRDLILHQVQRRMTHVATIAASLIEAGAPVVTPSAGHCVLLNLKALAELETYAYPLQSFLAWLYLNTGIRGGIHSVGLQKNSSLNHCIRLAIPVGLEDEEVAEMAARLSALFQGERRIPDLTQVSREPGLFGDVRARYAVTQKTPGPFLQQAARPPQHRKSYEISPVSPPSARREPERQAARIKDIAIVGISGRFPGSPNLEALWENVREGRECLTAMPESRRKLVRVDGDPDAIIGGYLEDVDRFDAGFFQIDRVDAAKMDPQERLFLEAAWSAMEDAGYLPEQLADAHGARNVGVYAGAVWGHYQILGVEQTLAGKPANANSFHWSIANRVSYTLNLNGPSLTLDTACSSALSAVHLACEAIRHETCSMAFAGGVNLDLHPSKLQIMKADGVISRTGKTRSFGDEADGYVPGEGVGVLLLKPLAQALTDGDPIHGIIKSSAMNHDGHGSGFTVPNPASQRALIEEALAMADLDARSISYIEAHGTGTAMGDALEIQALSEAFTSHGVAAASCALGSVKTNIGHTEPASGMASIAKVLWQFRERELAPSLNAETLSPYIAFHETPFRLQRQLAQWHAPVVDGKTAPLRAGISTFGAGGANVHIILEAPPTDSRAKHDEPDDEQLLVLSAADEQRLRAYAELLSAYIVAISRKKERQPGFEHMATTLREGRISMPARLALIARSKEDAWIKLTRYLKGETAIEGLYHGHSTGATPAAPQPPLTAADKERIASYWVNGGEVDWKLLRRDRIKRVSLPTYPFADERYWLDGTYPAPALVSPSAANDSAGRGHSAPIAHPTQVQTESLVLAQLRGVVADLVRRPSAEIDLDTDLKDYGFDSLTGMKLINRIHDLYGCKLSILSFFEYATLRELHRYLLAEGFVTPDEHTPKAGVPQESSTPAQPTATPPGSADEPEAVTRLREMVGQLLRRPAEDIDPDKALKDYDFDSLTGMKLINRIHDHFGVKISILSFFEYGTVNELYRYLVVQGIVPDKAPPKRAQSKDAATSEMQVLRALRDGLISPEQAQKLRELAVHR